MNCGNSVRSENVDFLIYVLGTQESQHLTFDFCILTVV